MPPQIQVRVVEMLLKKGDEPVVAWAFNDITPGKVPFEHAFELEDYSPICEPVRRTCVRTNEVIKA